jgi:ferredoxin-NADP reductase
MAVPIKFTAEVARVIAHGDDVATYEFRYLDKRPRYKAGQFVHLALDPYNPASHWPESRVFTIAAGASSRELLRLTIAAKGNFTRRILAGLEVGRRVALKGPYGEFFVQSDPQREVVLIGGGTGVTPFVAFMEDALERGIAGDVWLNYAARTPELLVFRPLADQCAATLPRFRVSYYAESEATEGIIPGRIDLAEIRQSLRDARQAVFYLCGPQPMIDAFTAQLTGPFGLPAEQVKTDHWE